MIRAVVFDFGQVLVHFKPSYMVGQFVTDRNDARLLEAVVFDRLYWDPLDAGTISDEEVIAACRARLPERLWDVAGKIYYAWIYNIPEIEGMRALLGALRENGVPLYLLSNISAYFAAHRDEISILSYFEKCVFSAVCGRVKPNADIFAYLCDACDLRPEETLFIDDSEKNIAGAEAFGIHGYRFDGDVSRLRLYLAETLGISL